MSLVKIEELIKELVSKIERVSTNENLEAIAAKIIKDVSEKLKEVSEKLDTIETQEINLEEHK